MTIAIESPVVTSSPQGRHRDDRGNIDRTIEDLNRVLKAALAVATGSGCVVVLGIVFERPTLISGGSWAVLAMGVIGFVLQRAEKVVDDYARKVNLDGAAAGVGNFDSQVHEVAGSQVLGDSAGEREVFGESSDLLVATGRSSGGQILRGAHALLSEDDTRGLRLADRPVDAQGLLLVESSGRRARERFAVVRYKVASQRVGRGPAALNFMTWSEYRRMFVLARG